MGGRKNLGKEISNTGEQRSTGLSHFLERKEKNWMEKNVTGGMRALPELLNWGGVAIHISISYRKQTCGEKKVNEKLG